MTGFLYFECSAVICRTWIQIIRPYLVSVALLVARRTNNRKGVGSMPANIMCIIRYDTIIGVDPARVRGSGPSWNFASEGPLLFGPSQNVWSTVMKHNEHNLCQYQWILMINEWLCDMSHCCHHHQTRFWAVNAPKMRPGLCHGPHWELTALPRHLSCVWGGRFATGNGRGGEGKEDEGKGR